MGAGSNRMNKYTVSKATKGLADYLKANYHGEISVVIAYDSRHNSQEFSVFASEVLCANDIKVFLFDTLMPTPVLSFAVKHLSCKAGIVITASHNPKEYNGYKIYDENGCQLVPLYAGEVIKYIDKIRDIKNVLHLPLFQAREKGLFENVGDEVLKEFLLNVKKQSLNNANQNIKIVYTPLHGSGNIPVRKALSGYNISIVKSQEMPDGNFSTISSPNPEERDALLPAIEQAKKENADLVLGTDPDCDRVGVAARHQGEFVMLTGNQVGALLVNYVLGGKKDKLNKKSTLVKTIVTSELGANIARSYGLNVVETLTGFKYIGEQIGSYDKCHDKEFVIGYEESYGYLVGTHCRDKDAVISSLLICEMAGYYHSQGKTLIDVLNELYSEYGYYYDKLDSFTLKGKEGVEKISSIMSFLRENSKSLFDDTEKVLDYSNGIDNLPKENVLKFVLADGTWFAVRPSGTEPKLKIYYSIRETNLANAQKNYEKIRSILAEIIEN